MINRDTEKSVESKEIKTPVEDKRDDKNVSQVGLFTGQDQAIKKSACELFKILVENDRMIVGYEPYPNQSGLELILGKVNPLAPQIIKKFIQDFDVNVSNRFGLTILHNLLWHDRPDLAKLLLAEKSFNKINFKFAIPCDMTIMYASALDLAITSYLQKIEKFDLDFIALLLKNGAIPPNPKKKFLNGELIGVIFPLVVSQTKEGEPTTNILSLLELLHCYGFSIDDMAAQFHERLFTDGAHEEFASEFSVNREGQETILKGFIAELKEKVAKSELKKELLVELTPERLNNGEDTLFIPDVQQQQPCCIM